MSIFLKLIFLMYIFWIVDCLKDDKTQSFSDIIPMTEKTREQIFTEAKKVRISLYNLKMVQFCLSLLF